MSTTQSLPEPPNPSGWWSAKIERAQLIQLLKKRDAPGVILFLAWLLCVAATTWALAALWGSVWAVPMLVVHGAVLSFAYAASHECAHSTAFRSRWLNEAVFYVTSFVFMEEPMNRRYSHGRHHAYTWYHGFDSQMPYRNPMTLRVYLSETLGFTAFAAAFAQLARFARGKLRSDELSFIPAARIAQLTWGARGFLLGYAAIVLASVASSSWFPVTAFFGARLAGGWVVHMFINSQHMCMLENHPDHRYTTRSLRCWPVSRLLYWNMNYHIEHHLYPGVPFHSLPQLNARIRTELPEPVGGALHANVEILRVIRRQASDPGHAAQPAFSPPQL
jgi:fatty acid desaturase